MSKQSEWQRRSWTLFRVSGWYQINTGPLTVREKEILGQIENLRREFINNFHENSRELGFRRKFKRTKIMILKK